jgi:hypothetical protein
MALSLDIKIGGSLWSAAALTPLSHSWICRLLNQKKAASKPPHSKASRSSTLNLMPLALKSRPKLNRRSATKNGSFSRPLMNAGWRVNTVIIEH